MLNDYSNNLSMLVFWLAVLLIIIVSLYWGRIHRWYRMKRWYRSKRKKPLMGGLRNILSRPSPVMPPSITVNILLQALPKELKKRVVDKTPVTKRIKRVKLIKQK